MTTEQLRNAMHATPFRPFMIHMADGREVRVPHPDFLAHTPNTRTAIVTGLEDTWEVIDLLLVTSLKFPTLEAAMERSS